ncbi:MAG: hypothetical protein M0Z66_08990 [Thermaerobacter sp.]|nr:hypothetical protein [Thermaerobacter sp.]
MQGILHLPWRGKTRCRGNTRQIEQDLSKDLPSTVQMSSGMQDVVGYRSGVLGVVGALCREIGLVDVINEAAE